MPAPGDSGQLASAPVSSALTPTKKASVKARAAMSARLGKPPFCPGQGAAHGIPGDRVIAFAYGIECRISSGVDRLFGGPEWAKWDGFDIQALIPEGTPAYTSRQFFDRQAPELQQMLQALLEDQFGLTLRHETREMSVYLLTRGKDGPKLRDSSSERDPFLARWKEGDKICCESSGPEGFQVFKRPIADMARIVSTALDVPVLDRTGLAGEFNYRLGFAYQERRGLPPAPPPGSRREPGAGPPDSRSLFAALEQDLGLKLEPARLPMEVLVIERAEKPSEN